MFQLGYRNQGGVESLVVSHTVAVGASTGTRWYELRVSGGAVSIFQQGTYAPDDVNRWMGSAAMDGSGDIALGFSTSSSVTHPGIHYTARLAGDPAGTMPQGEGTIIDGGGSQTSGLSRWGDYSAMTVDPSDDCTFWYANEYLSASGSFNWHTRIASFRFPACGGGGDDFSIGMSPGSQSIVQGGSATFTVSTAVTSGSATTVTLSAGTLPPGMTASFSANPITLGGESTLTVSADASTPPGAYALAVTGTSASAGHSAVASLFVRSPGGSDFSLAVQPATQTVVPGIGTTYTIATAVTSGSPASVSLSVGALPAGVTASFSANPITSGGSATLTVGTASTIALGTYPLTVTGTSATSAHSATGTLVVSTTGGNLVQNGGFESGNLTGWTTSFNATAAAPGHTGTYAARLGNYHLATDYNSIQQTVTLPSGGYSTLSFWYQPHCVDSIAVHQVWMELRDHFGTGLTTVLDTCTNSSSWIHVTRDLSAFHGQVVLLFGNRNVSNPDQGYTLFDDISVVSSLTPPPIVNGGFDSGDFTGWSTSGPHTAVIRPHDTPTFFTSLNALAELGSGSSPSGDSTMQQTITVPAAGGTLSFFYNGDCTDARDRNQVQIRSPSGATLATVLDTCTRDGLNFVQVTRDLSAFAGQRVVLWFNNHHDSASSSASSTLFYDVAVQ
jgi:hypothetical protein